MNYILVIWTTVAAYGNMSPSYVNGWRPIGDFQHEALCIRAAAQLGITDPRNFRCLKKTGN